MRGHLGPARPDSSESEIPEAERLLEVVLRLSQSAIQPDALRAMLSLTAPLFGTDKAMYLRVDRTHPSDSVTEVIGVARQYSALMKNRAIDEGNIWRNVLSVPAGGVFTISELIPIDLLTSRPLYAKVTIPAGVEYCVSGVLENGPEYFSNFAYMRSGVDFDERDKRMLKLLLPHMQAVLQLSSRIAIADMGRREALRSFDRARQPVVILDRSGYAIYSNDYATRVLKNADGLDLKFGRFLFDNVTTQTEFERAVRVAVASVDRDIQAAPHEIRVMRLSGGSPYALVVIPLVGTSDRALLPDGATCLILIHDLERTGDLPLERLAWLYGLTPAEVRICDSLFRVGSVDSTARDLSLTRNTVRSHLKSIYAKFGVTAQGQLMQRLANSVTFTEGIKRDRFGVS